MLEDDEDAVGDDLGPRSVLKGWSGATISPSASAAGATGSSIGVKGGTGAVVPGGGGSTASAARVERGAGVLRRLSLGGGGMMRVRFHSSSPSLSEIPIQWR